MKTSNNPVERGPAGHDVSTADPNRSGQRSPDDDQALIARIAAGDELALGLLYDRWAELVFAVSARIVDRSDAEEVLESTFWQAWQTAERYDSRSGQVSTWLTMIARSRALDRRRKGRRRAANPLAEKAAEGFQTAAECPLTATISHEQQQMVADAINRLPAEQRETVELAFFGGLSQREIAAKLKQPLGTIKTRARLASAKLKNYLSVLSDAPNEQY